MVKQLRSNWLPTTVAEMKFRGWEDVDVVLISGDAYVDHPSFGSAVVARIIEDEGLRVAIVPQPNWQDDLRDFKKFGRPNLFFGVTSGCMDSMVNHYTAKRRIRSNDAYTPGGEAGFRPDYAVTVYTKILKDLFPDVPVVLGGIEASLRRVTHYDYWADKLFPTILEDSGADMLVYGMGDLPLREVLRLAKRGVPISSMKTIAQTAVMVDKDAVLPKHKKWKDKHLSSHELCLTDKKAYAANFKIVEKESNKTIADRILQDVGDRMLVINPPYATMTEGEIDSSFDLNYTRMPHPKYHKRGTIPAFEMIKFSINMHRGCFGGCSFCTISAHQGKFIASRSRESILKEVDAVTKMDDFKGYISDLGGPSGNMYKMKGIDEELCKNCSLPSCIHPRICPNLNTDHGPMVDLYRDVAAHPDIKKAVVSSGIRFDMMVNEERREADRLDEYTEQLLRHHVSGRLKVAPEHTSDDVLHVMRKPSFKLFHKFKEIFDTINEKYELRQQLIPYFISAHPGSELKDMANVAVETKEMGFKLEQVQGFTPTPMTVATVIYYSGYHPYTMEPMYTARDEKERDEQNRFFFWYKREHRNWIRKTLSRRGLKEVADRLLDRQ